MKNDFMLAKVKAAQEKLREVIKHTPLERNSNISKEFSANILLKREDLQIVRSFKIRGAFNKMSSLTDKERHRGIVCASAGNHAQGVAFCCNYWGIKGIICMPLNTPKQKVNQVKLFGNKHVKIVLTGDTFDDTYHIALNHSKKNKYTFIHPFDDYDVIAGQGTLGLEILEDSKSTIDYIFVPIGGGGLAAGICSVFSLLSPKTRIIGVQPIGAPSMSKSIESGKVIVLDSITKFVDGASVKQVGEKTFEICQNTLHNVILITEGKVCNTILKLYNEEGIIVEPAGTLAIAALDFYRKEIKNKNIVCIISGGNSDIGRIEEIRERALLYEGLKHYFIISFPQRPGALKEFINKVLSPDDDLTYFQYLKKNNREKGSAVVGIELIENDRLKILLSKMKQNNFAFKYINNKPELFEYIL